MAEKRSSYLRNERTGSYSVPIRRDAVGGGYATRKPENGKIYAPGQREQTSDETKK